MGVPVDPVTGMQHRTGLGLLPSKSETTPRPPCHFSVSTGDFLIVARQATRRHEEAWL